MYDCLPWNDGMEENWEKYRVLSFEKENEKWLEFVCACRKGEPLNTEI